MNIKELREIIELVKEMDIAELEIEREGVKVKIRKGEDYKIPVKEQVSEKEKEIAVSKSAASKQEAIPETTHEEPRKEEKLHRVISPIVGTFYRAPSPEVPPYAKEGDSVNEGQTICIIEAMKLMNEIKSETNGKIVKILVENGQAVEYGQELFLIEPAS